MEAQEQRRQVLERRLAVDSNANGGLTCPPNAKRDTPSVAFDNVTVCTSSFVPP